MWLLYAIHNEVVVSFELFYLQRKISPRGRGWGPSVFKSAGRINRGHDSLMQCRFTLIDDKLNSKL